MPTYYDHGLGVDDPTQITETGDELASAANYIEPENVDYAQYTWENQPISESVTLLTRDEDFPQLSSSLIYITIPSGSPHNIYDSTNTVLVSGNAQENNDRDFTLDYILRGVTTDTGSITEDNVWSFTTVALEFGNTEVVVGINSDIGIRDTTNVIISRTPSVEQGSPTVTITTPTIAPTATTFYDELGIGGTAVDPNSLPIQRVDYTATASGDTVYTQYFTHGVHWTCLANCTWDGDSYNESGPGLNIRPVTGSWYVGFRPDYIRVTVDSSGTFDLRDNTGTQVVDLPVTPGVNTLPITWAGNDLGPSVPASYVARISNASGEISNIEFGSAGVGTDESGTAVGTDNWSFTVPLILGDTTVDVTGSNSYSLSGSDSIVVTRTASLDPVVTITIPTTSPTAETFYDTIDIGGTVVDPNPLPISSVTWTTNSSASVAWTDYTNNTWWYNETGVNWNAGGWWDLTSGNTVLEDATGSKFAGLRPDEVRLTFGGNLASTPVTFNVTDEPTGGEQTIVSDASYDNLDELALTFLGPDTEDDIYKINLGTNGITGTILAIEFGTIIPAESVDSGSAVLVGNDWSFNTALSSEGSNIIDVTGVNSYSASGSDSIAVTIVTPQNPIVTITTETTGASALEMTVEGTASDPNGFTITNVNFVTTVDLTGDTVQYFDNTKWQDGNDAGTFIWSGSQWEISSGGVDHSLEPIGVWSTGYRPLSIVLNGGPFAAGVTIKDTNGSVIGQDANPISGDQIDLTFTDYDIGRLTCGDVDSNMLITNIRFVEADTTTTVDSGDATGTTNWTLDTVLSSAGNAENTITVTAINDWSPPLSGGDTLIVTYNPPSPPAGEDFNDRTLWDEPEGVPGYWGILDGNTVWNTDHYECSGTVDVNFIPTAWARSVRPTKVRMYHTAGSATFQIIDQNSTVMATGASYASGTELDITYDGQLWENNIYRLQWALNTDGGGAGNITAIEFLEPDLDYFYDYFVGQPGSNERWISRRIPTGGNWDLDVTGGNLQATMDDEDQIILRQIWNQGEIDVWGELELWDSPGSTFQIYMVFRGDDGANASEFTLQWDSSQYNLNIQANDGGGSDELDLQDIGQNNVWIRLKYKPVTDSDTKMHLYYAYSDPTVGGWTEASLTVSPIFDPAYTATGEYWRLEIEFVNDSTGTDLGMVIQDLIEWTE